MPRSLVDIRIYRATLVLALLSLVVVMFSLEGRPPALTSTLAPDAFDEHAAFTTTREIAERYPDRAPGGSGDDALADLVEGRLRNLGFEAKRDEFSAESDGQSESMTNVVATLSGRSDRQLVVMAHRDSRTRPGTPSASATGMLLELARSGCRAAPSEDARVRLHRWWRRGPRGCAPLCRRIRGQGQRRRGAGAGGSGRD